MTSLTTTVAPFDTPSEIVTEWRFSPTRRIEDQPADEPDYVHVSVRRYWAADVDGRGGRQATFAALSKADAITVGQALIDAANELPDPFPFEDGDVLKGGAYSLVVVRNGRIEWFDGAAYSLAEPDPSKFTKVGRLND